MIWHICWILHVSIKIRGKEGPRPCQQTIPGQIASAHCPLPLEWLTAMEYTEIVNEKDSAGSKSNVDLLDGIIHNSGKSLIGFIE